jgi:endonuclease/exonuclease/phosphatase (EEP) superfamily protein YafD
MMKIVVQNLQKIPGLASQLVREHGEPDILLVQEISLSPEEETFFQKKHYDGAHNTSRLGYGTAIYGRNGNSSSSSSLSNIRLLESPHAEVGGWIRKKTTVASYRCCNGGDEQDIMMVEVISFHGYNGQPFKNVTKLKDHVDAVLSVVEKTGPAIFAGDFNTWTQNHVDVVEKQMALAGFHRAFSWLYPGREIPLDHVFIRSMTLQSTNDYGNESDHKGAVLEVGLT